MRSSAYIQTQVREGSVVRGSSEKGIIRFISWDEKKGVISSLFFYFRNSKVLLTTVL